MEWKDVIGKLAPTVASALLGPAGGAVVAAIGGIFGLDGATEKDIQQRIENGQLTPEQIAGLRELELKLQAEEKERGFRYAELEFKDRDSARNMAIQTGDKTARNITYLILVSFIGVVGCTLFGWTNADTVLAGTLIGYLSAKAEQAIAFWLGSTDSSKHKNELLLQARSDNSGVK